MTGKNSGVLWDNFFGFSIFLVVRSSGYDRIYGETALRRFTLHEWFYERKKPYSITPGHFWTAEENGYITTSPFYYYELSRGTA